MGIAVLALATTFPDPASGMPTAQEGIPAPDSPVAGADREPRLEVTLFGGRRVGGLLRVDTGEHIPLDVRDAPVIGGRVGWRLGSLVTLQVDVSRQETVLARRTDGADDPVADVALESIQVGPRFQLARGVIRPHLAVGLGVLRLRSRDSGVSDLFPSLSAGPGFAVIASRWLAFTGDVRFHVSRIGRGTAVPCQRPEAGCLRTGNDTILLQIQLAAGVTVRF